MPDPSYHVERCAELYYFAEWPTPGELFVTCHNCPGPSRTPSLHRNCCLNQAAKGLLNDESKVGSLSTGKASAHTSGSERKIDNLVREFSALTLSEDGSTNGDIEMLAISNSFQEPVSLELKAKGKLRNLKRKEAEPGSLSSANQYRTDSQLVGDGNYRADAVPAHVRALRCRICFPGPSERIQSSATVITCEVTQDAYEEARGTAFHQARPVSILPDLEDSHTCGPGLLGEGYHPGILIPTGCSGLLKNVPTGQAALEEWRIAGFHMDTSSGADEVRSCMDGYYHGEFPGDFLLAPSQKGESFSALNQGEESMEQFGGKS